MRKLKSTDAFAMMRLVKEAGVRDEFTRIALMVRNDMNVKMESIGADLVLGVIEGLASVGAEKRFFEFCSGILEKDVAELQNMELLDFFDLLMKYKDVEDVERWKAFFDCVANLIR